MPIMPIDPPLCADMGCRWFRDELCTVSGRCPFLDEFGLDDQPPRDREVFAPDELAGLSATTDFWED